MDAETDPTVTGNTPAAAAEATRPEASTRREGQENQSKCKCAPSSRNLIVCIDGTANKFSEKNTNVVELYSRLVKGEKQLTFYTSGIGTYAAPSWKFIGYIVQKFLNGLDLALALRFENTIIGAYEWLADNYEEGDRIFIFGFSRGAYQARALSAMIHLLGLIQKGNHNQIPFAYELYAAGGKDPRHDPSEDSGIVSRLSAYLWAALRAVRRAFREASTEDISKMQERFKRAFSRDVEVHFVGAWDTVSSVGLTRSPLPGTTDGMNHVCFFRHALAAHERRVKFLPEYVNAGYGPQEAGPVTTQSSPPNPANHIRPHSKEVWFPGCHSDIGGGERPNANMDSFGPSLRWMSFEARVAGVKFLAEPRAFKDSELGTTDSMTYWWMILEYLPVGRLTYHTREGTTRRLHIKSSRVYQADQLVSWCVGPEDRAQLGMGGMQTEKDPYTDAESLLGFLERVLSADPSNNDLEMFGVLLKTVVGTDPGQDSLRGLDNTVVQKLLEAAEHPKVIDAKLRSQVCIGENFRR